MRLLRYRHVDLVRGKRHRRLSVSRHRATEIRFSKCHRYEFFPHTPRRVSADLEGVLRATIVQVALHLGYGGSDSRRGRDLSIMITPRLLLPMIDVEVYE